MRWLPVLAFILLLSALTAGQDCGTTSCDAVKNLPDDKYSRKLAIFDAIFEGQIVDQSEPVRPDRGFPFRILTIKVSRVWKGTVPSTIRIVFSYYDEDCLRKGELGKRIFYVNKPKRTGDLPLTGWCLKFAM